MITGERAILGESALWFALLMAVGAAIAMIVGRRLQRPALAKAAQFAMSASLVGSVTAFGALAAGLVARDFSLRYVATYTSVLLSRKSALSALWAGQAGLLVWYAMVVSACVVTGGLVHRCARTLRPFAMIVMTLWVVASLVALRLESAPFTRLAPSPVEGRGLHPQLLHAAMLLQPPLLLLALAMLVVPFGYAVSVVLRGDHARLDDDEEAALHESWRALTQQWLLASWVSLTVALALGLWWAQDQLGWFGFYFTWEPYASAPMLTWLTVTALLVVLVSEADRATGTLWTAAFVVFAFLLAAAAVFRLRGGIADSIRAVAATPPVFLLVLGSVGISLCAVLGGVATLRNESTRISLGGKLMLLGALLSTLGVAASHWRRDSTHSIDIGQVITNNDPFGTEWRFTSQGLSSYEEPNHTVLAVGVMAMRGRQRMGLLTSQQRQYFDANDENIFDPSTTVGAVHDWRETVSLGFLGPIDRTTAAVRITFVPLVSFLWLGVTILCVAMVLTAWPLRIPKSITYTMPSDVP